MNLDRLSITEAIVLMLSEDERISPAILAERKKIEQAVKLILRAFERGGRLFYVGAGTSGRLGVLDASECPPTFRAPPGLVQGIIAGGQRAVWESTDSAEDDPAAGATAIQFRGTNPKDVGVGIAELRDRAVRIIRELTGVDEPIAKAALEKSGWLVKQALRRLRPSV